MQDDGSEWGDDGTIEGENTASETKYVAILYEKEGVSSPRENI